MRERTGQISGQRKHMNKYYFEVNSTKVALCKIFLLNTLCISHQLVDTAILKKKEGGTLIPDKRGTHTLVNKISEDVRNSVTDHISKNSC